LLAYDELEEKDANQIEARWRRSVGIENETQQNGR
jgi:hypothetical protein